MGPTPLEGLIFCDEALCTASGDPEKYREQEEGFFMMAMHEEAKKQGVTIQSVERSPWVLNKELHRWERTLKAEVR